MERAQMPGPSSVTLPGELANNWIGSRAAGEVDTAGGSLTHYDPLAPMVVILANGRIFYFFFSFYFGRGFYFP